MELCDCCEQYKRTPRREEEIKKLVSRINRISGQLCGVKKMIEENRYCGAVLEQISSIESAVRSLGYQIFEEHLESCVSEKIRAGDKDIVRETVELVKRLN